MKQRPRADIWLDIRLDRTSTDEKSQQAYDAIYEYDDIAQVDSFYLWLMELFELHPGDTYLDISCGKAQLPGLAQKKGVNAHGLDLSPVALRQGRPNMLKPQLTAGNGQQLPFASNSFSVISNIGSLEHYTDMAAAVREMVRVLQPDGKAYILVPNTFSLLHNVWIAFRQGRTNIDQQPIQRYAARQEWARLLQENGLQIVNTVKYETERPRTRRDALLALRHPKKLVRMLATPFVPLNLACCFVFICRKAEEPA